MPSEFNCHSLEALRKALVRLHLDYCNQAGHPHFQKHKMLLRTSKYEQSDLVSLLLLCHTKKQNIIEVRTAHIRFIEERERKWRL